MRKLFLLLALLPLCAQATVLTAKWTNPITNEDGTALAVTAITQTRIEYGSCTGSATAPVFATKAGQFIATGGKTQQATPDLIPGTYCFRAYTTAAGNESVASNVTQSIVAAPVPGAPSGLSVGLASGTTAFTLVKQKDALLALAVGSLPASTPCIADEAMLSHGAIYYAVPKASVTFSGTVQPDVVFAACSAS